MKISIPDMPIVLLAVHLYDPDMFLFMFLNVLIEPFDRIMLGLSIWYHFHMTLLSGLAVVTLHSNLAVSPSLTVNGFGVLDVTSGLSITKNKQLIEKIVYTFNFPIKIIFRL